MKFVLSFALFLCLWKTSWQRSTPEDDSYVAAVLEYNFAANTTANLQNYIQHIRNAALQVKRPSSGTEGADIVVFPELTLLSGGQMEVPMFGSLREFPIPADRPDLYDPVLVALSAAASESQIYVVFNIPEICHCSQTNTGEYCPEARDYNFNTNVVLDRSGAVIDRFRKINLFGEFSRSPALRPDLGIFRTDFGVTFGHFICFDLLFQVPAIQLVQRENITDVIFPTMWFSELPYLTAVQIQEAYAYAMNVNFLASGANNVRIGSAGSGIYSGRAGALISTMPGLPTTRLLVARVPKVPGNPIASPGPIIDPPEDADSLVLIRDPSLTAHTSRLLVPGYQEFTLTSGEVSCLYRVRLNYTSDVTRTFRAFVHDGSNIYARRRVGAASCSVVSCQYDTVQSCPFKYNITDNSIKIEEMEIEMMTYREQYNTSLKCANVVYFPDTLQTNKFPLNTSNFTFTSNTIKRRQRLNMKLNNAHDRLIAFGIWGRIYTKDVFGAHAVTEKDVQNSIDFDKYVFSAKAKQAHYEYRATAFDGVRSYSGVASGGTRVCSVIACMGHEMETCGVRFPSFTANRTAVFEQLYIEATVPTPIFEQTLRTYDSVYHFVSADVSTLPLNPDEYRYNNVTNGNRTTYNLNLERFNKELYSFAIWGRLYRTDGQEPAPPLVDSGVEGVTDSATRFVLNYFLLAVIAIAFVFL